MASYIGQVKIGETNYPVGSMLYGECPSTIAASTAQKDVTLASFDTLAKGVTIHVKFTNGNTAGSPTLKVGSTDAKAITNPGGQLTWSANAVISFTYDGTNWVMNDGKNTEYSTLTQTVVDTGTETTGKLVTAKIIKDTVTNAINDLDGNLNSTAPGAGKTLTAFSQTNGKVSATFGNISITKSQVSDLGTIGAAAAKGVDTSIAEGSTSTNLPTSAAVVNYVQTRTASLTGAMHFIGTTSTALTDGATTSTLTAKSDGSLSKTTGFVAGDVVINDAKEFVWTGSAWELLGDEGSYALKSSTVNVVKTATLTPNTPTAVSVANVSIPNVTSAGTAPTLSKNDVTIPNVTSLGSASSYVVSGGVLTLTPSTIPTYGTDITATVITAWNKGAAATLGTAINLKNSITVTNGSAASLAQTNVDVVKP